MSTALIYCQSWKCPGNVGTDQKKQMGCLCHLANSEAHDLDPLYERLILRQTMRVKGERVRSRGRDHIRDLVGMSTHKLNMHFQVFHKIVGSLYIHSSIYLRLFIRWLQTPDSKSDWDYFCTARRWSHNMFYDLVSFVKYLASGLDRLRIYDRIHEDLGSRGWSALSPYYFVIPHSSWIRASKDITRRMFFQCQQIY